MTASESTPIVTPPVVREHAASAVVRLRAMRKALWMRQVWALEPAAAHAAAIQHEEVDRILSDPAGAAAREAAFYREDSAAAALTHTIDEASRALAADARWNTLIEVFALTPPEQHLLALAVALALDPTLGRAFAYLHDQPEMTYPTPWLAAALFGPEDDPTPLSPDAALLAWRLVVRAPDALPVQGVWNGWIADAAIVAWLEEGGTSDLPPGAVLRQAETFAALPLLYPAERAIAAEFLDIAASANAEIELVGAEGSGRGVLAGQIAAHAGKPLLTLSDRDLPEGMPEAEAEASVLFAGIRSARLHGAMLYWRETREPAPIVRRVLRAGGAHVVGRTTPVTGQMPADLAFRSIDLPSLDRHAREQLWRLMSGEPMPPQVSDWLLTPGEIAQLSRVAHAGQAAIQQACRRPSESLSLLVRMPLPFAPEDLILPAAVQKALDDFENQMRFRWDVYENWGFERLCPNGRGLIGLFAGPSGTGKTMAAQVLARKLGLELYRLDPAQVVNKYIGETEKRLKVIFDDCDRAHFMLLIDECEGLLGQRFSSKDAHDRWANLEIDYLLMRLERFEGMAVLSTNRKADLDAGFVRRIRFIIDFLPPGPEERARLWHNALPLESPSGEVIVDALDWDALASRVTLTGAEITQAALGAAFLARAADEKILMPHVIEAVRREMAKKGQTLRGFE
jgi:hypothetical protein